ncbi:MAG: UPF0489 family protein [Candidatus Omnitrophota bacterium]
MKNTPLKLIENHDEAYFFWKKLRVRGKPLVHLDAHIDFNFHAAKPLKQTFREAKSKEGLIRQLSTNLMYKELKIKEKSLTNIGNYIYPAIRDGMVTDFYWVVPGDRREFKKSLKNLKNIARSFFPRDPFETGNLTKEAGGALKARIYGRNFIFTTLEDLPENIEGALLDIDTDYLTTDTVRKAGASQDAGCRFPWMWPEELVEKLRKKKIKPSCVSIAYSVNGGFTPLVYKFLGDEVAVFLNGPDRKFKKIISDKNNALRLFKKRNFKKAAALFEKVLKNSEDTGLNNGLKNKLKANIAFLLFRCYAALKNLPKAQSFYRTAVALDKTYKVRDNNYGPLYLRQRRGMKKAEKEFGFILAVDKDNPHALSGMADILMRRKKFKKARSFFKKAYAADRKNTQALFGLARAEISLKNYKAALGYIEKYKQKNPAKAAIYSLKAAAYDGLGMFEEALREYKLAHRFGVDLGLYIRLFKLLKKTGIPEDHKEWIHSRIDTYEKYRKGFFKNTRQQNRTKRLIQRIDTILKDIRKKR